MEAKHISELLPAVLNKELQKQECKPLKNGDDLNLEKAIASPQIRHSDLKGIKSVLKLVMLKLGIRANNIPNEDEKAVLIDHILANFGGNRVDEIKLAFDMAIAGKLGIEDVNCYENFSCAYFSKIMNAYRFWAVDAIKTAVQEVEAPQRIFSNEELEDGQRKDVEVQYGYFLRGFKLKGTEFNIPILLKDKLINEGESLESFFKRMIEKGQPHIYVQRPY